MPRRSILSAAERESLLALPDSKDDLIRHYTFNDTDLSIIRQRRGPANRLGFAVQLCYLRFPGVITGVDELPFPPLLKLVADQLKVGVESWNEYGQREQTRREHLSGHCCKVSDEAAFCLIQRPYISKEKTLLTGAFRPGITIIKC
jgi:TnpA family transposase